MSALISILQRFINSDMTKPLNTMIDEVKSTLALIKTKTDLITTNLFTSTHASRIDAAISSRQADVGLTSTHVGRLDATISTRADQATVDAIKAKTDTFVSGGVKSIQRGTTILASGLSYKQVAISTINMNKSTLNFLGSYTPGTNPLTAQVVINFVNSSTINIQRSSVDDAVYVSWEVIEYY